MAQIFPGRSVRQAVDQFVDFFFDQWLRHGWIITTQTRPSASETTDGPKSEPVAVARTAHGVSRAPDLIASPALVVEAVVADEAAFRVVEDCAAFRAADTASDGI
jgi:hypothetical protein